MRLDPRDANLLEIREPRAQRVHISECAARVVEALRVRRNLVAAVRKLLAGVHLAKPVQAKTIRDVGANVKRRHTPASEQPLVRPGAEDIDAGGADVDGERPDALDGIRVEQRAVRVRDVGDGPHVVPQAVQV
jgi:hypothetical protein